MLLNKGDEPARFEIGSALDAGDWRDATGGETVAIRAGVPLALEVPAHGVRVLLRAGRIGDPALRAGLARQMKVLAAGTGG